MTSPRFHILVCTNERPPAAAKPCCGHRGGLALYREFKDRIRERQLRDQVIVTRTGCLKHCSRGMVVAIWPQSVWLAAVTADDVDEILTEVILQGKTVPRLAMPDIPWE